MHITAKVGPLSDVTIGAWNSRTLTARVKISSAGGGVLQGLG